MSLKLVPVSVVASIARENVAAGFADVATPVAPLAGVIDVTAGAIGPDDAGTTSIAVISGSSAVP